MVGQGWIPSIRAKIWFLFAIATFWWSAAGIIDCDFLKPDAPYGELHIKNWKKYTRICEPALLDRKGPVILHDNNRPQVAGISLRNFANWISNSFPVHHISPTFNQQAFRQLTTSSNETFPRTRGTLKNVF